MGVVARVRHGKLTSIEDQHGDDLTQLQERVDGIESKLDYLENQSWRSNIRIDGVTESPGETWTERVCTEIFANSLGLTSLSIERAHRTGPKVHGKPRGIIVKFLSFKDRKSVL